jgi:hypothetical protein
MEENKITCVKCGHTFGVGEVLNNQLEQEKQKFRVAFDNRIAQLEEKHRKDTEEAVAQKLAEERKNLDGMLREQIQKDFQQRLSLLNAELETKRKETSDMQKIVFENEKLKHDMQQQRLQIEMEVQRKKNEEMEQALKQIKESVANEYEMKMKDKDFQINKMKEQIAEVNRKAEQGSMQMQGEVQELALEEMLRNFFPHDLIQEVPKGVKGADSIQVVRNFSGQVCGKIVYESKRTKNFEPKWIEKLKHDMRELGASVAVLVTEAMPADMDKFGSKDGIWICSYAEVKSLSFVLRDSLLKIQTVLDSQENREDKLGLLYNYITGDEFRNRLEAVAEGFRNVKETINKERIFMEKMWAEREKQMEKAMSSTVKVFGSVRGIVGSGMGDLKMLED